MFIYYFSLVNVVPDVIGGVPKPIWQGLVGAALHSYRNAGRTERFEIEDISRILHFGKSCKSSWKVLSAVADYLDLSYG